MLFRSGDFVSPKHLSTFRGVAVCQYTKYEGRNIAINIGRIDEKQPLEMQIDVCEGCDQPLETEKVVLRTLFVWWRLIMLWLGYDILRVHCR